MFKLFVVLAVTICVVKAGIIGGLGYGHGAIIAAPVAHVAESYQNNNQISLHPTPIVVSHAAPVIAKVAAPVLVSSHSVGLGAIGYGGHGFH
ncbi:hypothetical protein WA026_013134 [Henosepilachna vigintioctopunctata]|uniref:Uncharacterized protein n=1 Tax=Henosepilachna vigintioctopunctata TaxID=420089 RepID=A0AAW1UJ09_9CUCU